MKSSARDICRERKTDVNMESMLPPKRTRTGNKTATERGAKTKTGTDGVNEVMITPLPHLMFKLDQQWKESHWLMSLFVLTSGEFFQTSESAATAMGAAVAALSAERGASAPRGTVGLNVSAEGIRGTSRPHPNSVREVLFFV